MTNIDILDKISNKHGYSINILYTNIDPNRKYNLNKLFFNEDGSKVDLKTINFDDIPLDALSEASYSALCDLVKMSNSPNILKEALYVIYSYICSFNPHPDLVAAQTGGMDFGEWVIFGMCVFVIGAIAAIGFYKNHKIVANLTPLEWQKTAFTRTFHLESDDEDFYLDPDEDKHDGEGHSDDSDSDWEG